MSKIKNHINIAKEYTFTYSFDIYDIIEDWNSIDSQNIYLHSSYLKAIQDTMSSDITFIYVMVYQNNRIVGLLYFQWIKVTSSFFHQKKIPQEINSTIRTYLLKKTEGSLLLCGNFFATGSNGFFLQKNTPPNLLFKIIQKLRCKLYCSSKTPKLKFVMLKEFWQHKQINTQKELHKKTVKFQIDVNMVLEMIPEWKTFNDYLLSMTTKYRTRAKSTFKKTSDIVTTEFDVAKITQFANEIDTLYNAVLKTASFSMVKLNANSFIALKKELNENFIFKAYFKNNQLIGFSTACINYNYLDANFVGIDYQVNTTQPIYQKILYDYVSLAISKQLKELRLGRTAETIKSALGAKPKEMSLYIKHMNPILHTLLKPLTQYVKPSIHEIRTPFKKNKST